MQTFERRGTFFGFCNFLALVSSTYSNKQHIIVITSSPSTSSRSSMKPTVGGGAGFCGVCIKHHINQAYAGFPPPSVCSGHYPVLSGFRQSQHAVPRRAPTCLSPDQAPSPDSGSLRPHWMSLSSLCSLSLSFCVCSPEVTVTSLHPPRLWRLAVFSVNPPLSLTKRLRPRPRAAARPRA